MFKIKLSGGRTMEVEESTYWHTSAHILAQAVNMATKIIKVLEKNMEIIRFAL